MTRLKIFSLLIIFALLSSCAAKKRVAEFDAQPVWIKQKPIYDGYYVGVGLAKKIGTAETYIDKAQKDAMADMAEEVSVQINSSSVLHTIETHYGNTDFFDQRIEITANDYLEGYEPVDVYQNEDSYWVYYRIEKETYHENKSKRKAKAITNARAKYLSAQVADGRMNPKEAISFYLQGLSAIKPYLAEETTTEFEGERIDMGNTLFSSLNNVVSSLSIIAGTGDICLKRGEKPGQPLEFIVLFKGKPVRGIPVSFSYSGGYLKDDNSISDTSGLVYINTGKITSRNEQEQIQASINLKDIANNATEDLFIRGLTEKQEAGSATVNITISLPGIAILIEEGFCMINDCESIKNVFTKNVVKEDYRIETLDLADFVFSISLNYNDGESAGGLTSIYLQGNIKLLNIKFETIWTKDIKLIKGVGESKEAAREEAFSALLKSLNLIYFREGLKSL